MLLVERPGKYFEFPARADELGLDLELGRLVALVRDRPFRLASIKRGTFGSGAAVEARWVNIEHLKVLDVRPQVMADAVERYGVAPAEWPAEPLVLHG